MTSYSYTRTVPEHVYVDTLYQGIGGCGYANCIWPRSHPIHVKDSSWPMMWTKKNTKVETGWMCPICNKSMMPEVDDVAYSDILDATVHADCLVDSM